MISIFQIPNAYMTKITSLLFTALIFYTSCQSQITAKKDTLTLQDTLRGSITAERAWWDVIKYDITVEPDFATKTLKGTNVITFRSNGDGQRMQLDMQKPMEITRISFGKTNPTFTRNGNVYYVDFKKKLIKGEVNNITVEFRGKPREAVTPPWDGGWIWQRDSFGNPWMSVACQGLGASVWYPCKDHQSDEPDSALLTMIVPSDLTAIGNGRLRKLERSGQKSIYTWAVVNPINSYNIVPYIGRYVNWTGEYNGEKGKLDLSYWVLEGNLTKAKKQFTQVIPMLKCFEHWFGPYPFYEDGYKLVESPHLGMEHQSAIAYGNGFENGYLGKDLSGTGWGKKWDFIIVHESAHEWFANNITTKDIADMWVHEGFTNYSEVLFITCEYGVQAGNEYAIGLRKSIHNDKPLIAPYGVNKEGSVDMYAKGANLVHTIRQIINDDEKFRTILRNMNKEFYHQQVTSEQIELYLSQQSGKDLSKIFDQYLRTTMIPRFEFVIAGTKLRYRWSNCVEGFDMPLKIDTGSTIWLSPTTEWKETKIDASTLVVDRNFYISSSKM